MQEHLDVYVAAWVRVEPRPALEPVIAIGNPHDDLPCRHYTVTPEKVESLALFLQNRGFTFYPFMGTGCIGWTAIGRRGQVRCQL